MRFRSLSSLLCLAAASLLGVGQIAHATPVLITFEAEAAGAPSAFSGTTNSPLTIGSATFTGGQLLNNEIESVDTTGVYATTSFIAGGYSNPLTINFASGVSNFNFLLTNNLAGLFTVSNNLGESLTARLRTNDTYNFAFTGSGITSVRILQDSRDFDYAIDNVSFNTLPVSTAATPEPSSFWLLGTGLVGATTAFRRRMSAV